MGSKGPLTMVTPQEFLDRTSLTFSRRSGTTLKVDAAYKAYYELRSEDNANKLNEALHTYLVEHGRYWDRCERDKVSGGLLKWLYDFTRPRSAPVMGSTADERAQRRVLEHDVPHSRFGVLYLLGNIDIKIEAIGMVAEGIGAVGGAIGSGLSLDTSKLNVADSSRTAFTVSGTPVTGQALSSGGSAAATLVGTLAAGNPTTATENALLKARQAAIRNKPANLRTPEENALLQRNATVAAVDHRVRPLPQRTWFPTTIAALEAAGNAVSETFDRNKALGVLAGAGVGIAGAVAVPLTATFDLLAKLWNELKCAFYWIKDKIVAKIMTDGAWPYQMLGKVAKAAAKFVLDMVFKNAAPFVSGLVDIGTGLAKAIEMAWERAESYFDRKKIHILPGHPTEIANSIESAMTQGMLLGLKDMLKGVGSTVLQSMLPGLGSVVNAAMVALEWLIKLIWRVAEMLRIDAFLKVAREMWKAEKARATPVTTDSYAAREAVNLKNTNGQVTRTVRLSGMGRVEQHEYETGRTRLEPKIDGAGIISNLEEFTAFFKKGCDASPIIPMLTLNTGICGSLMTMIRLVDDTGTRIHADGKQGEFDVGNRYFARLKEQAAKYLRSSGFQFLANGSDPAAINGLLMHAVQHHQSRMTAGKAAMAVLSG